MAAIAYAELAENETAIIAQDARRDNVYAAVYKKLNDKIIMLEKEQKIATDVITKRYPNLRLIKDAPPSPGYLASLEMDNSNRLEPIYL